MLAGSLSSEVAPPRYELLAEAASRMYDRARGVAPGMFGPMAAATVMLKSMGGTRLYLRDRQRRQLFLRTVSDNGIGLDNGSGLFTAYTLDFSDAWVEGVVDDDEDLASGVAFSAIDLRPYSGATVSAFPVSEYGVQIAGTAWGLPAVPKAVQMRVFDIAHGMSQRGFAGGFGAEEALQVDGLPVWVMRMVDGLYNWRLPAVA